MSIPPLTSPTGRLIINCGPSCEYRQDTTCRLYRTSLVVNIQDPILDGPRRCETCLNLPLSTTCASCKYLGYPRGTSVDYWACMLYSTPLYPLPSQVTSPGPDRCEACQKSNPVVMPQASQATTSEVRKFIDASSQALPRPVSPRTLPTGSPTSVSTDIPTGPYCVACKYLDFPTRGKRAEDPRCTYFGTELRYGIGDPAYAGPRRSLSCQIVNDPRAAKPLPSRPPVVRETLDVQPLRRLEGLYSVDPKFYESTNNSKEYRSGEATSEPKPRIDWFRALSEINRPFTGRRPSMGSPVPERVPERVMTGRVDGVVDYGTGLMVLQETKTISPRALETVVRETLEQLGNEDGKVVLGTGVEVIPGNDGSYMITLRYNTDASEAGIAAVRAALRRTSPPSSPPPLRTAVPRLSPPTSHAGALDLEEREESSAPAVLIMRSIIDPEDE